MDPDGSWYTSAFSEDYLLAYAASMTAARTIAEVDGVEAVLGLPPGARVVDLACGQGRHAVELARRGYTVTGVDVSASLLTRARRDAPEAAWVRADMRATGLPAASADAVVNLFNAFGYLEDEAEDARVLAEVARLLAPGGLFLQEVLHRDALVRDWQPVTGARLDGGGLLVEEHDLDLRTSRHRIRHTLVDDAGPRGFTTDQRVYTLTELLALHRAAGLHPETVLGSLVEGGEAGLDDPLVVVRSRRAG